MKKVVTPAVVLVASLAAWGCTESAGPILGEDVPIDHAIVATFHQVCADCHQWQRVYSVSLASVDEAWSLVCRMVHNGADLEQEDEMALAKYLYELRSGG